MNNFQLRRGKMGDEGADHLPIHMNLEHKQEIALRKDLEPENLFVGELQTRRRALGDKNLV